MGNTAWPWSSPTSGTAGSRRSRRPEALLPWPGLLSGARESGECEGEKQWSGVERRGARGAIYSGRAAHGGRGAEGTRGRACSP